MRNAAYSAIVLAALLAVARCNMDVFYVDEQGTPTNIVVRGEVYPRFKPLSGKGSCPRFPTAVFEGKDTAKLIVVTSSNGSITVTERKEGTDEAKKLSVFKAVEHTPNEIIIASGCNEDISWTAMPLLIHFDSDSTQERTEYKIRFNFNCEAYKGTFSFSFIVVLAIALVVSLASVIKWRPIGAIGDSFVREDTYISLGKVILWVMVFSIIMVLINMLLFYMDITLRLVYTLIGMISTQLTIEDMLAIWKPNSFRRQILKSSQ